MQKSIAIVLLALLAISAVSDAQRRNNRQRGRGKAGSCHMKDVEKCLEVVEKQGGDGKQSELIKTSKGLDTICKNSLDVVKCLKAYMKKCGTPLQRELFDFGTEHFQKSVEQFCSANGQARANFLANSPCIHDKVLKEKNYKDNCVTPLLATLDNTKKLEKPDDRLDASCCGYNRWETCTYGLIEKSCGAAGREAMTTFMRKAFAGFSDMICTHNKLFEPKSSRCNKLYAPAGTIPKGKLSDNPVTKYMAAYFGFLFN